MTSFVTSADGTRIAYDRAGGGPPLVLVSGLFCHRPTFEGLAAALSSAFTVVNFDRRGRGESEAGGPYAVAREVEDVAALIEALGGSAAVYGHSSGAGLALHATAAGLPVTALVLHEPPYNADDEAEVAEARALAEHVATAIAEDRRSDAITRFLTDSGMPPEAAEQMAADPAMLAVAPTMVNDFAVMGDGGVIPVDLARAVAVPTMVLAGSATAEFFLDTARHLADLIPGARLELLDGADHGAPADVVAPAVAGFLGGA